MIAAVDGHSISKLHHGYEDKELWCMRQVSSQFISGQKFGSLFAVKSQKMLKGDVQEPALEEARELATSSNATLAVLF